MADAPQFGHVHGLGVDPADGTVYAATHHGIFTLTGGNAVPVGRIRGDFMGFTIVGPGTFLASGHPAPGSSSDRHFGLLESSDSGRIWTVLSLAGQADFHAFENAHGTIYGYDSTRERVRASADRQVWDDRAVLQATDLAVHPADANVLLAATDDGARRSTDAGRTFAAGTAPVLAYLSWPQTEALYGIDPGGRIHRSRDAGTTWQPVGSVPQGSPEALTALTPDRLLVATDTGVYESRDGGVTFTQLAAFAKGG